MLIRPATREDLTALTAIYNQAVLRSTATFDLTECTPEDRLPWFLAHGTAHHPLLVAEDEGTVLGYASLSPYRDKEAYDSTVELSVYVDENRRHQGIATALMQALLNIARSDPRTHMVVSVITAGNEASLRLHRRFGFLFCGAMPELGRKFDRWLSIENWCLPVKAAPSP